jgi:peptide-methionine (S)-S-oxide reductase
MQQALASKEIYQNELTKNGMDQIVTQILPASGITYWLAEDYHQRYLEKNPNGYDCHSSTGVAFPTVLASNNG